MNEPVQIVAATDWVAFLVQLGILVGIVASALVTVLVQIRSNNATTAAKLAATVTSTAAGLAETVQSTVEDQNQRLDVIHTAVNGNAHKAASDLAAAREEILRLSQRLDETHTHIAELRERLLTAEATPTPEEP